MSDKILAGGVGFGLDLDAKNLEAEINSVAKHVNTELVRDLEKSADEIKKDMESAAEEARKKFEKSVEGIKQSAKAAADNSSKSFEEAAAKMRQSTEAATADIGRKFEESAEKIRQSTKTVSDGIEKEVEEAAEHIKQSVEQSTESVTEEVSESAREIDSILNDSEKSQKAKAAKIAQIYKKEGLSMSDAMKKAWEHIERGSSDTKGRLVLDFAKIKKAGKAAAAGIVSDFKSGFKRIISGAGDSSKKLTGQFGKASDSVSGHAKRIGTAIVAALSITAIAAFGNSCLELGSDLAEVQNVVDVTFPNMTKQVDKFAKNAALSFGLSETMAKQFTGTFGAMSKSFGFSEKEAYKMSTTLTGLAGDVASFYNMSQDEAYTKLKSVFTGETETLKDLGVVMTQTALDSYALANGFGKVTAKMTEAEKVSLRYQFVQDKLAAASGDFIRTSSSWANQVRILSLQIDSLKAKIGQGLINLFTPIIQSLNLLLLKLQAVVEAFSDFTSLLTGDAGGASVSDAAEDTQKLTQATNDAAKAAEKAKKKYSGLLGIDNINSLSKNTDSSSSTDTSSASTGSATPQEGGENSVSKAVEKWAKTFKDAIRKADFTEIGDILGTKLGNVLDNIPWDEIKTKAQKVGQSIGTLINGFVEVPGLGKKIGNAIANGIDTAVLGLTSFVDSVHWDNVGSFIADGVNGIFDSDLLPDAAKLLGESLNAAFQTLDGFSETLEWKAMGDKIVESINKFLDTFEAEKNGLSVGKFVSGIATTIYTVVSDKETWAKMGEKVGQGIKGFFKSMNEVDEETGLTGFQKIGQSINNTLKGLKTAIAEGLEEIDFGEVFKGAFDLVTSMDEVGKIILELIAAKMALKATASIFTTAAGSIGTAISTSIAAHGGFVGIAKTILTTLGTKLAAAGAALSSFASTVATAIGGAIEAAGGLAVIATSIAAFAAAVVAAIGAAFAGFKIGQIIGDAITGGEAGTDWKFSDYAPEEWLQGFKEYGSDILDMLVTGLNEAKEKIGGIPNWFKTNVVDPAVNTFSGIKKKFKNFGDKIINGIIGGVKGAIETIGGIPSWFKEHVLTPAVNAFSNIKNKFLTVGGNIISGIKSGALNIIDTIGTWISNKVITPIVNGFSGIKEKFLTIGSNIVSGIKTGIKNIGTTITTPFKNAITAIVEMFNKMIDKVNAALKFDWGDLKIAGKTVIEKGSVTLAKIPKIKVPAFAEGSYLKANTPQLAVVGDNRHQGEFVAPEDKLKKMAAEAASMAVNGGGGYEMTVVIALLNEIISLLKNIGFVFEINGRRFAQATIEDFENEANRKGGMKVKVVPV